MARKNIYGRYIIAAGEVGAFTVCPEAWRLKVVEKARGTEGVSSARGVKLHEEWARKSDEIQNLVQGFRLVFTLIMTAIVLFLLTYNLS